ncbi:MAG TPA: DUF4097 family beta strand repeat-containing protein [Terracidiphilus sp.]|jgi:DUF4097 and DUF4098 domain-containing protein YvlB
MLVLRPSALSFPLVGLLLCAAAATSAAESDWQKSYPVSGKPSLFISTGDSSTEVRSCGSCREVHVRVEWNDRRPDDFNLTESQSGDHVIFELKEKPRLGIRISIGNHHEPRVTVESPNSADLEARTSDGALKASGLEGTLVLHTGDGSIDVADAGGSLRLTSSDGSIRLHNVTGTLESHSSDGSVSIDGRLSGLQVHTSDGRLDVRLADGSQLTSSSRIESSDGRVTVRLPRTLSADIEVHTGDGKIDCQLPITMSGYNSGGGHNIRGHLNAGGVPLTIHTGDGSVTIAAL